jgi:hypothetical protein
VSSAVVPPGRSGLIFGDILGSSAGETCTELILDLFLLPRGASCGVFLSDVALEPARSCGLCVVDDVVLGLEKGEWKGCNTEFFPEPDSDAERVGVRVSTVGVIGSLGKFADSGSSKLSIWSEASGS